MFALLIFACCADIKHRIANTFDKHGICPQPSKSHKIEKYKCDKDALKVIVMYSLGCSGLVRPGIFAFVLTIIIGHFFQILRDAGAVAISLPTEV